MSAPRPIPQECPRKQLVRAIRDVITHIIDLNIEMMEYISRGNTDKVEDLREQLAHARTRKDSLLESHKQHMRVHGC